MSFWGAQPCTNDVVLSDIVRDFVRVEVVPLHGLAPNKLNRIIQETSTFLKENYRKRTDSKFPLVYEPSHIKWFFFRKESKKNHFVFLRHQSSNTMLGVVACTDTSYWYGSQVRHTVAVSLLCVSERLRNKTLAPILMQTLINETKEYHDGALFMAPKLPIKPLCVSKYVHRPIK